MTGHLLGAAGGIEAIACVQTLQEGKAHPTVGYQVADPDCDLDYVTEGARDITDLKLEFAMLAHQRHA
jgi:3-oxoacyl-[acyl-carrier-protein] synthase II